MTSDPDSNLPAITLREETHADIPAVRSLLAAAFEGSAEAELVDALRNRGAATLSLVACRESQVVGHLLFSEVTIQLESSAVSALGLGPMAVLPQFQRQGIGSSLLRWGLELCVERGFQIVVVLGHPGYYPRFGFLPARNFGIRCQFDAPEEAFMVLELVPGALSGVSGEARYQPEFSRFAE